MQVRLEITTFEEDSAEIIANVVSLVTEKVKNKKVTSRTKRLDIGISYVSLRSSELYSLIDVCVDECVFICCECLCFNRH